MMEDALMGTESICSHKELTTGHWYICLAAGRWIHENIFSATWRNAAPALESGKENV